jgi:hypothetical protein
MNERMSWLVIIGTILIVYPTVYKMNKRLLKSEIYMTVVFGLFVQTLVDTFASAGYKAWGFYEVEKIEFKALWIIMGIYPFFAALIINWYPYDGHWWRKWLYLMAWSTFSTGYEWLTMKVGIMWHINWNLFYSFLLYPFIYYLLIIHVKFYRWLQAQPSES